MATKAFTDKYGAVLSSFPVGTVVDVYALSGATREGGKRPPGEPVATGTVTEEGLELTGWPTIPPGRRPDPPHYVAYAPAGIVNGLQQQHVMVAFSHGGRRWP